jgi:hypothetical protein
MTYYSKAPWCFAAMFSLTIAACGGGGSSDSSQTSDAPTLNATQLAIQDAYSVSGGGAYLFSTTLPSAGALVSGVNFAYTTRYALAAPLSIAPQRFSGVQAESLSASLPLPDFSKVPSVRALVAGKVVVGAGLPSNDNERLHLAGELVVLDQLGVDGVSLVSSQRIVTFETKPLSGTFASAPAEVLSHPPLVGFSTNSALLKPGAAFVAGSAYHKRTALRDGDAVFMNDCGVLTYDANLTACAGATTLETAFPQTFGTTYGIGDGTVQTLQGLRAWVATSPIPSTTAQTPSYLVLVEMGGKVYRATLQRDGAPIRNRLIDGTIVDYTLRFNLQAVQSLRAAVAF